MELRILRDWSAIDALHQAWRDLVEKSTCNRAFASPAFFRHSSGLVPSQPCVVTAHQGNELTGVLPLVWCTRDANTASRRLAFGNLASQADYQDLITEKDDISTAQALVRRALKELQPGDSLELSNFRADSNVCRALAGLEDEFEVLEPPQILATCPHADVSAGWDSYRGSRTHKFRKSLALSRNRTEKAGFERVTFSKDNPPSEDLLEAFLRLHLSRKETQNVKSVYENSTVARFFRSVLHDLSRSGEVRIHVLREKKREIFAAMLIETFDHRSLALWQSGMDPAYQRLGPGVYLLSMSVQDACQEGLEECDFMRGTEDYKKKWMTGHRNIYKMVVCPSA